MESDSFPQFFNRILPKLFSNIFSWNIPDKQKGWIILQTIQLGSQSIEEGMDRYKTFSVSFPLLFKKILNKDIFSVNQKLELFQSSFETLCQTQCMNLLLNQGIPFLLDVFMTFESFSLSMKRLTSLISSPSSSRIIENLQQISEFIKEHFGAEVRITEILCLDLDTILFLIE